MAAKAMTAARRLTDAQLMSAQFQYFDPENTIAGLNRDVPDPAANPTIIGYYDETPPGGRASRLPFIRCCHCGKRRHWKGHVIRDDRGETYIIGTRKCGREHYGIRFDAAEKAFKAEQARRSVLIRWNNMLNLVEGYREEVTRLLQSAALGALELKRDELHRASPDGIRKLTKIANTAQPMFETLEFRDVAAEDERRLRFERAITAFEALPSEERRTRRDEGLKPEKDTTPIYRQQTTPLGHLVGGGFLTESGDVRCFALALRKALDEIVGVRNSGTDHVKSLAMSRLLREMTDGPQALNSAITDVSFTPLFFERDNLDRIARWSVSDARFTFSRAGPNLMVDDTSKGRMRIEPLDAIDLPYCDNLQGSPYIGDDFLPEMVDVSGRI
jgi:hypothetical protein